MNLSALTRILVVFGLLGFLAGLLVLHGYFIYPLAHVTVLYALPMLVAAWLLPPRWAVFMALAALAGHSLDAWLDGTPLVSWAAESITLALIAALGIWLAEKSRAQIRLARELEQTKIEREQFLSMVTHEIKGILGILSGYAQLITRADRHSPETLERASLALPAQIKRLTRLVNDLQDLSRMERGRFEIHRQTCDLVKLAREVVEEEQATTTAHRLVLATERDSLPGSLACDRITQVIGNLVRNAITYSPEGDEVRVSVELWQDKVRASVSDFGWDRARRYAAALLAPLPAGASAGGEGYGTGPVHLQADRGGPRRPRRRAGRARKGQYLHD